MVDGVGEGNRLSNVAHVGPNAECRNEPCNCCLLVARTDGIMLMGKGIVTE